jgi:hypothetical protein
MQLEGRELRRPAPLPLRIAVFTLAGVVVASLGGLAAAHLRPGILPPAGRGGTASPSKSTSSSRPQSSAPTTSTTLAVGSGSGAPVLASLAPSTGHPGQQITILGSGFFSTNGTIVVTFGGVVVPTRCPTEQRCVVTVPPPPRGATSVAVQLRTSTGTSNARTFSYD